MSEQGRPHRGEVPVELLFLAPGDVRKARVEPISWMRTCEAFAARGLRVTLATLRVRYPDAVRSEAVWGHFGIPPSFRIRMLPTPLRRDSSTRAYRLWGGLASTALAIAVIGRLAFRRRRLIVYSRSPIMLTPFSLLRRLLPRGRQPTLVHETHAMPAESTWRILRRADLLVVNSRRLEADLATRVGIRPERILHAPLPPTRRCVLVRSRKREPSSTCPTASPSPVTRGRCWTGNASSCSRSHASRGLESTASR